MPRIEIFDTTLRDGEQGKGISFTVEDKIKIAKILDDIGIDYIEGGWPGSNPKAMEFFDRMKSETLSTAKLVAFGSTRRFKNSAKDDVSLNAIINSGAKTAAIFGKSWDMHVREALKISLDDNLAVIYDSIKYLKDSGMEAIFDSEHFFDGYKHNPEYTLKTILEAQRAGADAIVLCDTNGGALPGEVANIVREIKPQIKCRLGIHAHNDSGLGVANSIIALEDGITHIQGTINGYGERCGNANLCSIIPILKFKMQMDCISSENIQELTKVSHHISEIANMSPEDSQPFVGNNAFAHKAGIHVSAILKNPKTYEHIEPELIGNKQNVTISELSGMSNLVYKAESLGIDIDKTDPKLKTLVTRIKELENQGYAFEEGEASFELLLKRTLGLYKRFFTLEGFRVIDEKRGHDEDIIVEATIKISYNGEIFHTAAEGNGPVSALDNALHESLDAIYPTLSKVHLTDYKVRVLDSKEGTSAMVRVLLESTDGDDKWGTVGVSANIIEASWNALVDSIEYKLLKDDK
jgi:2-isopropylmalate synthase